MNILHVRSSDVFSSPERMIIGQCLSMPDHSSVCASFVRDKRDNIFLGKCRSRGLATIQLPDSFPGDLRVSRYLRRIIDDRQIDVVVSHDYRSNFYSYLAVPGTVRLIGYFHGVTAEDWKVRIYNAIDRLILRRFPLIIAVSSVTRQRLIEMRIREDRIVVVPNAIDESSLFKGERSPQDPRAARKLVAAGRFSYEKGYDLLLEALKLLDGRGPSWRLDLYGAGPEEGKLRQTVQEFGLQEMVHFGGFVDDILPIFRQMDILVQPSRSEGMPVTILEAWSQKLGVIATAAGGTTDILRNGENGLLIPPNDPQALAESILVGLTNIEKMYAYGRSGYELVQDKYTYTCQARLLQEVYKRKSADGE
jgi:glycosyltransferase involved in cell wall biosynthesis